MGAASKDFGSSKTVRRPRCISSGQGLGVLAYVLNRHILDNQNILVQIACLDSGKTRTDAVLGEITATVEKLQWTIKHGENALKSKSRPTNLLTMTKRNEVRYEPRGVVAALVSWKYVCRLPQHCRDLANIPNSYPVSTGHSKTSA